MYTQTTKLEQRLSLATRVCFFGVSLALAVGEGAGGAGGVGGSIRASVG